MFIKRRLGGVTVLKASYGIYVSVWGVRCEVTYHEKMTVRTRCALRLQFCFFAAPFEASRFSEGHLNV